MVDLIPVQDPSQSLRAGSDFDAVVAVGPPEQVLQRYPELKTALRGAMAHDAQTNDTVTLLHDESLAGGRLIVSPTGRLDRDFDDVRRFADAAARGVQRARDAGARQPLLLIAGAPARSAFARAEAVAILGAAGGLWQPLEAREALGAAACEPIAKLGVALSEDHESVLRWIRALEEGRRVARDIGGTEPERMSPANMAAYCQQTFEDSGVQVTIVDDVARLKKEYPLLMAVGRASLAVERHRPRVIRLEYKGEGNVERTLLLAGKGLVYDTGGADIKAGGHMAGMSRDKGGGAAVAGFLKTVAGLKPRGLRVVAEIGAVRNSVGADSYVSDEILVSHAGVRVRVGNTDAEGRLVLADLLSHLRERALKEPDPTIFSVATLTGHAALAAGPYTIAIENEPARAAGVANRLATVGDAWGDPFEISRSRREDFDFVKPRTKADDVLSCNNKPSSQTSRGHQFPMAFLSIAAGLVEHGHSSKRPLPYTHLDVAGSATEGGDWQHGRPTGAPVVALATAFLE